MRVGGLPPSYAFSALAYSAVARIVIATVQTVEAAGPRSLLLWRRITEKNYREISSPAGLKVSRRDVVLAAELPLAYFCEYKPEAGGWNWRALMKIDLETMKVSQVLDEAALAEGRGRRWLAGLIGSDSQGTRLFCIVGREESNGVGGVNAVYELCRLSTRSAEMEVLTPLEWVYL